MTVCRITQRGSAVFHVEHSGRDEPPFVTKSLLRWLTGLHRCSLLRPVSLGLRAANLRRTSGALFVTRAIERRGLVVRGVRGVPRG